MKVYLWELFYTLPLQKVDQYILSLVTMITLKKKTNIHAFLINL